MRPGPHVSRRLSWILFGVLTLVALASFQWAERMELRGGFGWDGLWYGTWAQDFHRSVIEEQLSAAEIQRVLAPAIVHYGMRAIGAPLDAEAVQVWGYEFRLSPHVLRGFEIYHTALFVLLAFVWMRVMERLELRAETCVVGALALFANFAVLKEWFFDPVSTDPTALVLGAILLLCYLNGSGSGVLATTAVGAFSWPTIIYAGALLYVLPRHPGAPGPVPAVRRNVLAGVAATTVLLVLLVVALATDTAPPNDEAPIVTRLLPLTIVTIVGWTFLATRSLVDDADLLQPRAYLDQLRPYRLLGALLLVLASKVLFAYLGNDGVIHRGGSLGSFSHDVFRRALVRPFNFIVPHVGYWGPVAWLVVLLWPRICRQVSRQGLGLVLFVAGHVVLSLNAESRQLIFAFPFFVAFTLVAVDELRWGRGFVWVFGGSALLLSRFWINLSPLSGPLLEMPMQRYMMNFGGWLTDRSFLLLAPPVLLIGLFMAYFARHAGAYGAPTSG